jgi:hypothetical protein
MSFQWHKILLQLVSSSSDGNKIDSVVGGPDEGLMAPFLSKKVFSVGCSSEHHLNPEHPYYNSLDATRIAHFDIGEAMGAHTSNNG